MTLSALPEAKPQSAPRILIIVAPFYQHIADMLLAGATARIAEQGAECDVLEVAGALEIPPAMRIAMEANVYDGFLGLGCVIRGETTHYETVCNESARGIMEIGTKFGAPVGNGILTVENEQQAIVRADPAQKNKGAEAATACLQLVELARRVDAAHAEADSFLPDDAHIQLAEGGEQV